MIKKCIYLVNHELLDIIENIDTRCKCRNSYLFFLFLFLFLYTQQKIVQVLLPLSRVCRQLRVHFEFQVDDAHACYEEPWWVAWDSYVEMLYRSIQTI